MALRRSTESAPGPGPGQLALDGGGAVLTRNPRRGKPVSAAMDPEIMIRPGPAGGRSAAPTSGRGSAVGRAPAEYAPRDGAPADRTRSAPPRARPIRRPAWCACHCARRFARVRRLGGSFARAARALGKRRTGEWVQASGMPAPPRRRARATAGRAAGTEGAREAPRGSQGEEDSEERRGPGSGPHSRSAGREPQACRVGPAGEVAGGPRRPLGRCGQGPIRFERAEPVKAGRESGRRHGQLQHRALAPPLERAPRGRPPRAQPRPLPRAALPASRTCGRAAPPSRAHGRPAWAGSSSGDEAPNGLRSESSARAPFP
jgi:hypothetical protein